MNYSRYSSVIIFVDDLERLKQKPTEIRSGLKDIPGVLMSSYFDPEEVSVEEIRDLKLEYILEQ